MSKIHTTLVLKEVTDCDVRSCQSRIGGLGSSKVTAVRFFSEDVLIEVHLSGHQLKCLRKALGVEMGQEEVGDLLEQLDDLKTENERLKGSIQDALESSYTRTGGPKR